MLSYYRSGSTLLLKSLAAHPRLVIHSEPFNVALLRDDPERVYRPVAFLNRLYGKAYRRCPAAVGCKMMYGQATSVELSEPYWGPNLAQRTREDIHVVRSLTEKVISGQFLELENVWEWLASRKDIKVIHLVRANLFHSYVSFQIASLEDNWIRHQYVTPTIDVCPEDLRGWFERLDGYRSSYGNLFRDHEVLQIDYDGLVNNYEPTLSRVFRFLDLEPVSVSVPPLNKQGRSDPRQSVSNFGALLDVFADTPWIEHLQGDAGC